MENRPTAAPRHERPLGRGTQRLQLYSCATPNGQKVTIALEAAGAAYDAHFTSIFDGDQFGAAFTAANPNQKIPTLIDTAGPADGGGGGGASDVPLMESGAILLHIAEAYPDAGLLPADAAGRTVALQWLFWLAGAAPYFGQYGHFRRRSKTTEALPYPLRRYEMETCRLLDVLDRRLAAAPFVGGDAFSIADCAVYPWVVCLDAFYDAAAEVRLADRPHLQRWMGVLRDMPAVKKGMTINAFDKDAEFHEYSSAGKAATATTA